MNKTYFELLNYFFDLNKKHNNFLSEENVFEFIYDNIVYDKTTFVLNANRISQNNKTKTNNILSCLKNKIPWERILKYSYFYGLKFHLFDGVFSPRFDTEILVQTIINDHMKINKKLVIYDLGSGTSCINIVLAKNLKNAEFSNFEISQIAYQNSLKNIRFHNINNIKTFHIDYLLWLKNNEINANIIVCNPPYININYSLECNVKNFDPSIALFANDNGLFFYKEIIRILLKKTNKMIYIYFEIGYDQKIPLESFLLSKNIKDFSFVKDLNKKYRVLKIILNKKNKE